LLRCVSLLLITEQDDASTYEKHMGIAIGGLFKAVSGSISASGGKLSKSATSSLEMFEESLSQTIVRTVEQLRIVDIY
jgi:hypothetical protein